MRMSRSKFLIRGLQDGSQTFQEACCGIEITKWLPNPSRSSDSDSPVDL